MLLRFRPAIVALGSQYERFSEILAFDLGSEFVKGLPVGSNISGRREPRGKVDIFGQSIERASSLAQKSGAIFACL